RVDDHDPGYVGAVHPAGPLLRVRRAGDAPGRVDLGTGGGRAGKQHLGRIEAERARGPLRRVQRGGQLADDHEYVTWPVRRRRGGGQVGEGGQHRLVRLLAVGARGEVGGDAGGGEVGREGVAGQG